MLLHCVQDMKANRPDDNSTRTVPHAYARGHTRTQFGIYWSVVLRPAADCSSAVAGWLLSSWC